MVEGERGLQQYVSWFNKIFRIPSNQIQLEQVWSLMVFFKSFYSYWLETCNHNNLVLLVKIGWITRINLSKCNRAFCMMILRPYDLWLGVDFSNVEKIGDNKANLLDDIRIEFGTQVNSFLFKNKLNKMMNVWYIN